MKAAKKVILILILSIFFSLNTFAAGTINSCGTLSTSGLWILEDNLIDATNSTCITLNSTNIIIDCQGHWINTSNSAIGNYGIFTNFFSSSTIQNCKLGNWGNGGTEASIFLSFGSGHILRDIVSRSYDGLLFDSISGAYVDNFTSISEGNTAINYLSASSNINFNDIDINSPTANGINHVSGSNNINYTNIDIDSAGAVGFNIEDSNNVRVSDFRITDSTSHSLYLVRNSDNNVFTDGFLNGSGNEITFFESGTTPESNQFEYVYVSNASEISSNFDWNTGSNVFYNMFWDNVSLFDPCDELYTYDVCDENPYVYLASSEQLRIEMIEYVDHAVTYSPLEGTYGIFAGANENFSHYNITGYLIVTNNNPDSLTLSDIYLEFDYTTNITIPTYLSGRFGSWINFTPSSNYLRLHIPELRSGENATFTYRVNYTTLRPPLNVTSNYSDTKLLGGGDFTIRDTLSNDFDAASYQGDVCIRDITLTQNALAVNFSNSFYDFSFNTNYLNGTDANRVTYSSDNLTQTWDVLGGACLYNNNDPYIMYNLTAPYNIPTSAPYEAVNTTLNYTIDETISQFRLTSIRAISEEGINFEKQIIAPSDPILYGSNVTWNVSGSFRSSSDISYDLERISFWVSQRNFNGSYTDPNSFDNDTISNEQLNITYYPGNITNTFNSWRTNDWLFNYSDVPSPIVWMETNLTIRNDNYQLINRTVTRNGNDYHVKEIYLIIGYWLEIEKNISAVGPDTYQIRIDVHNKGNQVTPSGSIVTIYDFVEGNFEVNGSFVYSSSPWYNTTNTTNNVTGEYNGSLIQWAVIPSNSLNTSFAQGPNRNENTTWSVIYNVTGSGDYTLLDVFITGLDPQKVDGAGSTRAVIVEEFIDKLRSVEGLFATMAVLLVIMSFLI